MTQKEYEITRREYERYYKTSDVWKAKREARMKIDGYKCVGCGCIGTEANPLTVHHIAYKSKYGADSRVNEDLVTLCASCHALVHRIHERVVDPATNKRGWSGADKDLCYRIVANIGDGRIYYEVKEEINGRVYRKCN